MKKLRWLGLFLFLAFGLEATAQDVRLPGIEISGGYNFANNFQSHDGGHGWFASAAHGLDDVWGLELHASGTYYGRGAETITRAVTLHQPGTDGSPGGSIDLTCPGPRVNPACQATIRRDDPDDTSGAFPVVVAFDRVQGAEVSRHLVMGGPRVVYGQNPSASPFFHAMTGLVVSTFGGETDYSPGAMAGGGANFWTDGSVGVRLGMDYLWSGQSELANELRLSVGLTWKDLLE